jgi:hypothetical protein
MVVAPLALLMLATGAPPAPDRVLVVDVAGTTLSREEAGVLRDTITDAVGKVGNNEVLSSEDVRRVLALEADKQELGCEGEQSCLAEIGAALGAQRVVYGTVARLGARYVVSLSLIEPGSVKTVGRDRFEAESLEDVARQLPNAVGRLFGAPVDDEGGFPVISVFGGVVTGAGALAGVGFGAVSFYLWEAATNPRGDPQVKQLALDQGQNALIATAVGGGVFVLGLGILSLGLLVE